MRSLLVAILALTVISTSVLAQAPDSLSFQGFLTDDMGNPIDSTGLSITFNLYKGATSIWMETQSVDVDSGVFNVYLGAVTAMDTVAFNQAIDLGIKVGGDSEISPRTPLTAAAYAKALPGLYTFYRDDGGRQSYNVVGGAANNVVGAGVTGATIGGGGGVSFGQPRPNTVLANWGTVGGGRDNTASDTYATVGGGKLNTVSGTIATVGGGEQNAASGIAATVAGGAVNTASGFAATVGGGQSNTASDFYATVGGGLSNTASDTYATVGGGSDNTASGSSSTVPGGRDNAARGFTSFAAGYQARANYDGSFVWQDSTGATDDTLASTASNQFLARASGGFSFLTSAAPNLTDGVFVNASGRVGVGTNSPNNQLSINGSVDIADSLGIGTSSPATPFALNAGAGGTDVGITQNQVGGVNTMELTTSDSGGDQATRLLFRGGNSGNVEFYRGDRTAETLTLFIEGDNGRVGLSRNDPAHPFQVGTGNTDGNGAHVTDVGIWMDASSRTFKMDFTDLDKVGVLEPILFT